MKTNGTTNNSGQFTSWHMERASSSARRADNRYSNGDQTTKPPAGDRSKTLITDGRPSGTHFRENPWFDGGAGNRGPRAHELAKYNGTAFEKQSANDAPFMKGDRARNEDGRLRSVRTDQQIGNNPTLQQRAPELIAQFGKGFTVGQLEALFGTSLSQIAKMTQSERASVLAKKNIDVGQKQGSSIAQVMIAQQS